MYRGHAAEFNDPIEGPKIRKREQIAEKMNQWNGEPEVEMICNAFIKFLWESSKSTANLLKEEKMEEEKRNEKALERKRQRELENGGATEPSSSARLNSQRTLAVNT